MKTAILATFISAAIALTTACPAPTTNNSSTSNSMRNGTNTMSSNTNSMSSNTNSMTNTNSNMSSDNPMVGGAPMLKTKDIIDNASNSKDHTTLVAAVKAAGLVETLKGTGPFTVFAPTNEAFAKLPAGTVDTLLKPENKDKLKGVLTYHVVAVNLY